MKWNHIIVEGFCAKNWEYRTKNSKWVYRWVPGSESFETIKEPNPLYDPDMNKPKRPKYCQKKICSACIKCKYLAYSDVDEDLVMKIGEVISKYMDKEEYE